MKRYISQSESKNFKQMRAVKASISNNTDLDKLVADIEQLLGSEDIPYVYVDYEDDDTEVYVFVKTYGDWRNDNGRAHELICQKFHPDNAEWEQTDDDVSDYGLSEGSDSCVVRHTFYWNKF